MLGDKVIAFREISTRLTFLALVSFAVGCTSDMDTIRSLGSTKNLDQKACLPLNLADSGEKLVEKSGFLVEYITEDYKNNPQSIYVLKELDKTETELFIADSKLRSELVPGKWVTLKGTEKDGVFHVVEAVKKVESFLTEDDSGSAVYLNEDTIDQKTIVLLANFRDRKLACSVDEIDNVMFKGDVNVDKYFRELTNGAISYSGDVRGTFEIDASVDGACNFQNWGNQVKAQASAMGINLSNYRRVVIVHPQGSQCVWRGVTTVGRPTGPQTTAWVSACKVPKVFYHELAHNLGFNHASTTTREYGDISDVMGRATGTTKMSGAYMYRGGWIPEENIAEVKESGTYRLAPVGRSPETTNETQIIKIDRPSQGDSYFLSYRQKEGLDRDYLPDVYTRGVNVHTWERKSGFQKSNSVYLKTLSNNDSHSDGPNNIRITQLGNDKDGVDLRVEFTNDMADSCSYTTPSIEITSTTNNKTAGDSNTYLVKITNNNQASCPVSTYKIKTSLPGDNWSFKSAKGSVTLSPGASTGVNVEITSPKSASQKVYKFKVIADSLNGNTDSHSEEAEFQIGDSPVVSGSAGAVCLAK